MKIFIKIFPSLLILLALLVTLPVQLKQQFYDIKGVTTIVKTPLEEQILNQMTQEAKVGQLFMFGINGTTLNEHSLSYINDMHIGGVILMGGNIESPKQLIKLNTDLQSNSKIPLLISVDQEGGTVSRIRWKQELTIPPKSMGNEKNIYDLSSKKAALLDEYMINVNLAPVVEYITDPSSFLYPRVFNGTKEEVARKSFFCIKGYSDSKVIPVAKHYPGHSNSAADPHIKLPSVSTSKNEWDEYIYIFRYLIEKESVDMIMGGHFLFPNIDNKPSTISNILINEKLRGELGYDGVVITDDMQMAGIYREGEECNTAIEALNAGNDILLYTFYSPRKELPTDVYNCVLDATNNRSITQEEIDKKVLRILRLKIKYEIIDDTILNSLE